MMHLKKQTNRKQYFYMKFLQSVNEVLMIIFFSAIALSNNPFRFGLQFSFAFTTNHDNVFSRSQCELFTVKFIHNVNIFYCLRPSFGK